MEILGINHKIKPKIVRKETGKIRIFESVGLVNPGTVHHSPILPVKS